MIHAGLLDRRALAKFAGRHLRRPPESLEISLRPLRGGLESAAVARVEVRFEDRGRRSLFAFVAKRLDGRAVREASIYRVLVARQAADFAPGLLGAERLVHPAPGPADGRLTDLAAPAEPPWARQRIERPASREGSWHLYLEAVRAVRRWPWGDEQAAARLLGRLARLHAAADPGAAAAALAGWDYEADLAAASAAAVAALESLPRDPDLDPLRRALPALRRLAAVLPAARRQLLAAPPLGSAVLHGDVHPGNALVRQRGSAERPVLIDWGRARLGSPLEDVSSWLRSLGFWEPAARRRHDTLLAGYLRARGLSERLDGALRDAYWLAAASNVLAGALTYHLARAAAAPPGTRDRCQAIRAAHDALRAIRQADTRWRAGG